MHTTENDDAWKVARYLTGLGSEIASFVLESGAKGAGGALSRWVEAAYVARYKTTRSPTASWYDELAWELRAHETSPLLHVPRFSPGALSMWAGLAATLNALDVREALDNVTYASVVRRSRGVPPSDLPFQDVLRSPHGRRRRRESGEEHVIFC